MASSASVSTAQSAVNSVANVIAKGAKDGVKRPGFPLGKKKLFLPKHVLTFIRPKEGQPPNLATFKVPLSFNKFDFRDYLWNCYNVEVVGVRSFINQQRAKQRSFGGSSSGKWYRPRSIKMMIADLKQPFVWPEPPEDKEPWDNKLFKAVEENHEKQTREAQEKGKWGPRRVRSRGEAGPTRAELARAAKLLAYGLQKWQPQIETAKILESAKNYKPEDPEDEAALRMAPEEANTIEGKDTIESNAQEASATEADVKKTNITAANVKEMEAKGADTPKPDTTRTP